MPFVNLPPVPADYTPTMDTRLNFPQTNTLAAKCALAVTTNDTTDLTRHSGRGLYIGVSGDVKVDMAGGGTAITFKAVPVGLLNIIVSRVYATGTTATNIVALF
jgi:hypothetical protein